MNRVIEVKLIVWMKIVYLENKYFANSDNESDRYNKKGKKGRKQVLRTQPRGSVSLKSRTHSINHSFLDGIDLVQHIPSTARSVSFHVDQSTHNMP